MPTGKESSGESLQHSASSVRVRQNTTLAAYCCMDSLVGWHVRDRRGTRPERRLKRTEGEVRDEELDNISTDCPITTDMFCIITTLMICVLVLSNVLWCVTNKCIFLFSYKVMCFHTKLWLESNGRIKNIKSHLFIQTVATLFPLLYCWFYFRLDVYLCYDVCIFSICSKTFRHKMSFGIKEVLTYLLVCPYFSEFLLHYTSSSGCLHP